MYINLIAFSDTWLVQIDSLFIIPEQFTEGKPAICRICKKSCQYSKNTKGNFLKHYQQLHPKELDLHLKQTKNVIGSTKQGTIKVIENALTTDKPVYSKQSAVEKSIAKDLCAKGALPITIVERKFFRDFLGTIQPLFRNMSYRKNVAALVGSAAPTTIHFSCDETS